MEKQSHTRTKKHAYSTLLSVSFPMIEQAHFAKRLSFLLKSGTTLHESLTILTDQTHSRGRKRILGEFVHTVERGQYLSTGIRHYNTLFHPLMLTLTRVGEQTGSLSDNLAHLAHELRKRHTLRQKVRGALTYPALVTLATIGITGMLIVFIFPKLLPIFASLKVELPFMTQVLLTLSLWLRTWWLHVLASVVILCLLSMFLYQTWEVARRICHTVLLTTPIVGSLIKLYNAAQFCRTLKLTLDAGMSLGDGLSIITEVTRNEVFRTVYKHIETRIHEGKPISQTLIEERLLFPDILPAMICTAEASGSLSPTLGYLSDFYEAEIDDYTRNLSNSLEPLLLIVMGLTVGLIAVSVITPLYEITRHLQTY